MQSEIKSEMKLNLSNHSLDSEFILLTVTAKEFKALSWVEENEFSKNGILYDVVSVDKTENGDYIIKVIDDKKENQFLSILFNNSEQNSSAKKIVTFFFQLFSQFFSQNETFNLCRNLGIIKNYFIYLNNYSFLVSKQNFQPPKLA